MAGEHDLIIACKQKTPFGVFCSVKSRPLPRPLSPERSDGGRADPSPYQGEGRRGEVRGLLLHIRSSSAHWTQKSVGHKTISRLPSSGRGHTKRSADSVNRKLRSSAVGV